MLTDDQAAWLRMAMMTVFERELYDLGFVDGGTNYSCATEEGIAALEVYDAAQAAKRAAEIEAAYREGFEHGKEYCECCKAAGVDICWYGSDAKKSLEAE